MTLSRYLANKILFNYKKNSYEVKNYLHLNECIGT